MENIYKPVDLAFRKVRYGEAVSATLQEMAAIGYEIEAAYHVDGDGHYLYFKREMIPANERSDSDNYDLRSQTARTVDVPRDPGRHSH
jgi:hypothetical protein